jgi:hypothetical protein
MVKPSQEQARAMQRLSTDDDFKLFLEWIMECETAVKRSLVEELEELHVRRKQGECKALKYIQDETERAASGRQY